MCLSCWYMPATISKFFEASKKAPLLLLSNSSCNIVGVQQVVSLVSISVPQESLVQLLDEGILMAATDGRTLIQVIHGSLALLQLAKKRCAAAQLRITHAQNVVEVEFNCTDTLLTVLGCSSKVTSRFCLQAWSKCNNKNACNTACCTYSTFRYPQSNSPPVSACLLTVVAHHHQYSHLGKP